MSKIIITYLLLLILPQGKALLADNNRVMAIGNMQIAIEDIDRQINLFQIAGNNAWLKTNDTTSWTDFRIYNNTLSGDIRRHWDPQMTSFSYIGFRGQKHIGERQVFYGEVYYNWDYRYKMNQAIDKYPYQTDPFVLADSTAGDFNYLGPEISVIYSYIITNNFSAGVSLYYNINKGLKTIYTMPEIIDRESNLSLDLAWSVTPHITLGFSYKPYQRQAITKLVKQPDGKDPQTYRYRGEFVFRKSTASSDRRALFNGYKLIPQIGLHGVHYDGVILFNYTYLWHELYDNPSQRLYDGFYQAQQYIFNGVFRYYVDENRKDLFSLSYNYRKLKDWAQNPNAYLLIYQANYSQNTFMAGYSHRFSSTPLLTAVEFYYLHDSTIKNDYLAQVFRDGTNQNFKASLGVEYLMKNNIALRGGLIYNRYDEAPVWNYFGSYSGLNLTLGVGYIYKNMVMDLYGIIGKSSNNPFDNGVNIKTNKKINFSFEIKQYF